MDWLRKWDTLPQEVRQLILHNGADMERFYTLSTEERQEVLNRIRMANTPDELDATAKRKEPYFPQKIRQNFLKKRKLSIQIPDSL